MKYSKPHKKLLRTDKKVFKTYTEILKQVKGNFMTHKIAVIP